MSKKILVEKPTEEKLKSLGVSDWPTWQAQPSTFPWHYDATEMCYILEGKVVVKTDEEEVRIGKGDFVTFPEGLDCEWTVLEKISKHYKFES
jgi:uncharacterized cupin superfamily protein